MFNSFFVSFKVSRGEGALNKMDLTSIFGTADILSGSVEMEYLFGET